MNKVLTAEVGRKFGLIGFVIILVLMFGFPYVLEYVGEGAYREHSSTIFFTAFIFIMILSKALYARVRLRFTGSELVFVGWRDMVLRRFMASDIGHVILLDPTIMSWKALLSKQPPVPVQETTGPREKWFYIVKKGEQNAQRAFIPKDPAMTETLIQQLKSSGISVIDSTEQAKK